MPQTVTTADKFIENSMVSYGMKTIEDRAIPDYRDGLKPVQRRILWAMALLGNRENFVKAAKIVGDCMGSFHPHSDSSIFDAIATLVHTPTGFIEGQGNWGNPTTGDKPAAYRYVEARLAEFTSQYLLNREYLDEVEFVQNYDSTTVEPVFLPSIIPTSFLTGSYGIAVGVSTSYPTFSLNFVKKLAKEYLKLKKKGSRPTPEWFINNLEFDYKQGGRCISEREELSKLVNTGKATIVFEADHKIEPKKKTLTILSNAVSLNLDLIASKIIELPEVQSVMNRSTEKVNYVVTFKPSVSEKDVAVLSRKIIEKMLTKRMNFNMLFTHRKPTRDNTALVSTFGSISPVKLMSLWTDFRVDLEEKVMTKRLLKIEQDTRKNKVVLQASKQVMKLAKEISLKSAISLEIRVAKLLKISEEEAKMVLAMPLRSLSNLEQGDIVKKIKALENKRFDTEKKMSDLGVSAAGMID